MYLIYNDKYILFMNVSTVSNRVRISFWFSRKTNEIREHVRLPRVSFACKILQIRKWNRGSWKCERSSATRFVA